MGIDRRLIADSFQHYRAQPAFGAPPHHIRGDSQLHTVRDLIQFYPVVGYTRYEGT